MGRNELVHGPPGANADAIPIWRFQGRRAWCILNLRTVIMCLAALGLQSVCTPGGEATLASSFVEGVGW